MNEFLNYLEINNLNIENFYNIINEYMIYEIFSAIDKHLIETNSKLSLKKQLLNCENKDERLEIVNVLIKKVLRINATIKQQEKILEILYAYYRKSLKRKNISNEIKNKLYIQQNGLCSVCKSPLKNNNIEYDHKLPFYYVGDELSNNDQLLCKSCNRQKLNKYDFIIKKCLFN